jgi:formylglycine-generating enzyme required for sulfatase activity
MGSPLTEPGRGKFSETQVQVTLTHDIEMTKTEISQGQWSAMCFANPSGTITTAGALGGSFTDGVGNDYPVGAMTYWDALSFANALSMAKGYPACYKLSGCTGIPGGGASNGLLCRSISLTSATTYECSGYRLPTDAEFEYADRAGTTTATYAGDVLDRPDGGAVCYPDPHIDGIGWGCELPIAHSTQPVAKKKPNAFGLYDLIGNAFEWVDGDYNGLGYGPGPLVDPFGDVKISLTSLGFDDPTGIWRGGQIAGLNALCRSAARLSAFRVASSAQYSTGPAVGFRIVRTVK